MSANDVFRVAAVILVLYGIYEMETSKSKPLRTIGILFGVILFLDLSQWLPQFASAMSNLSGWFGKLIGQTGQTTN